MVALASSFPPIFIDNVSGREAGGQDCGVEAGWLGLLYLSVSAKLSWCGCGKGKGVGNGLWLYKIEIKVFILSAQVWMRFNESC